MAKHPQITLSAMAMIGLPTETWPEIKQTIKVALQLSELHPNLVINLGTFMPYPATPLYYLAIKEGFEPPKRTEDWSIMDSKAGQFDVSWIKWRNRLTKKKLNVIGRCAVHLNRTGYGNEWQIIAKKILHFFARQRLQHNFYSFPIELNLFSLYYKHYLQKELM